MLSDYTCLLPELGLTWFSMPPRLIDYLGQYEEPISVYAQNGSTFHTDLA